ncbi:MFS transporter [Actinoallomurus sp. NPDC050550]|uniref:MFS transporter n=1 Tax=Actinoallomurus sp. NPDC050550 TaxID=3154937 RepID=UPI0033D7B922
MPTTTAPVPPRVTQGRTLALIALLLAAFMDLIDVTILNVVLPSIEKDLGASPAQLQWMLSGYSLALALGMITGARLGDILGHKKVFLIGVSGFAAASALCGMAPGPDLLVAARVLQGLAAAVMIPQVLSQIQVMYAPHERGGAMAAFSALSGLAATVGPILGPALLSWNLAGLGWRLVFWVNVPVGVVTVIACLRSLPESRARHAVRIDVTGVIVSTVGLMLVLYPLIAASGRGERPVWTYPSITAGVLTLAGFWAHQRRVGARGGDPLIQVSLFRFRSVCGGLLVQLLFFIPTMGFFLVVMQFLQVGIGAGPMTAGLTILPWSVAVAVLAGVSAAVLLPRIGRATVQIGLVLLAAGFAAIAVVAGGATAHTGWTDLIWGVLIGGAGMGMIVAPLAQLTLGDVPVGDAGSGSALFNTVTQLAAAVGVAIIGTFFFARVRGLNGVSPRAVLADRFGDALAASLWLATVLLAIAFAATFLLPRRPSGVAPSGGASSDD